MPQQNFSRAGHAVAKRAAESTTARQIDAGIDKVSDEKLS